MQLSEAASTFVSEAFKTLLESKHLYQSVAIKDGDIESFSKAKAKDDYNENKYARIRYVNSGIHSEKELTDRYKSGLNDYCG